MILYLFILGLCVGSFINVVIDRIPHKVSILHGRSRCDTCHHVLSWYDLIPVVSFALLLGKCRYCKASLSFQYPLIEIISGFLFAISYILFGSPVDFFGFSKLFFLLCLFSSFLALAIMDSKYGILSDKVVAFSGLISLVLLFFSPQLLVQHILTGLICFGIMLGIFLLTKGKGMGFGDVKLSAVMGILLGFPAIIIAFYIAFLTGGLIAIILVLAKKKKLVGGTIAFGPFLLLGTYLSWYFSNTLWNMLLRLLGVS